MTCKDQTASEKNEGFFAPLRMTALRPPPRQPMARGHAGKEQDA